MEKKRCTWCLGHPLMTEYHDKEWGVPVHNDRKHYEFIILDTFQAGLSWLTVLKKRDNFRKAFSNFDPAKIARYTEKDVRRLLNDDGIIRNQLKISAVINNAKRFAEIQKEFGSFDRHIWSFTGNKTIKNKFSTEREIPKHSKEAQEISADLKKRGFRFVGPIICYVYMQAAGMVNDHTTDCFRYKQLKK